MVASYLNDPLVYTGKVTTGLGSALLKSIDALPARFHELEMPLLILHGTADRLCEVAGSRALEAGATNAEITAHYYDGLFHEVFNEPEHETVVADLLTWLESQIS